MVNNITNHNNMNHCYHKPQRVMDNNITNHNMNHCYHKPQTVMDNNITNHNNMNHSSDKLQTAITNLKRIHFFINQSTRNKDMAAILIVNQHKMRKIG
jgi:hypothetical protein